MTGDPESNGKIQTFGDATADALAEMLGDRYWDAAVAEGLGDTPASYHPPPALAGG
jgi:hypothetical protein